MSDQKPDIKKLLPVQAYAAQNKGNYKNADLWGFTVIPKDTILVQLDYDPKRLDKTQTAGQYFTTIDELKKHRDPHNGLVDTVAMSDSVQVMAHKDFETKTYKHYPNVTIYEVVKDMPVSYAHADNNRAFGIGGADVRHFQNVIIHQNDTKPLSWDLECKTCGKREPMRYIYGAVNRSIDNRKKTKNHKWEPQDQRLLEEWILT